MAVYKIVVRFLFLPIITRPNPSLPSPFPLHSCFVAECTSDMVYHQGECLKQCPEGLYNSYNDFLSATSYAEELSGHRNQCIACHYTCRTCVGANDYQCSGCFPDASLYEPRNGETYCYPEMVMSEVVSGKWYFRTFLVTAIALGVLLTMGFFLGFTRRRGYLEFAQLKTIRNIRGIEEDVKNTVYSDSDE